MCRREPAGNGAKATHSFLLAVALAQTEIAVDALPKRRVIWPLLSAIPQMTSNCRQFRQPWICGSHNEQSSMINVPHLHACKRIQTRKYETGARGI